MEDPKQHTFYFEKARDWRGINIEPLKEVYAKLVMNRPSSININCAIDETEGRSEFIYNKGYTEMISGLRRHYDDRHYERLKGENELTGATSELIEVETKTLRGIFESYGVKHVNYLSIDVEGAEFAVIKSIDFSKVFIDVIGFENNYGDKSLPIIDYLIKKGYSELSGGDMDIFMIHEKSEFKVKEITE